MNIAISCTGTSLIRTGLIRTGTTAMRKVPPPMWDGSVLSRSH